MILRLSELVPESKRDIRGGTGLAEGVDLLKLGDMDGILSMGRMTLEPGTTIGEHAHPNTEDLYLILEGHGRGGAQW